MRLIKRTFCAFWSWSALLQASIWCFECTAFPSSGTNEPAPQAQSQSKVRSINLPHFEPDLPMAVGRDDYLVVCVSCHSPRYVMMQPLFPQHQWEETVDKMVKVYGAQMDQDQRRAIVEYLVTTHGPEAARVPARDDDSDFASAAKPVSPPEAAPSLNLTMARAEYAKEVDRGAELFKQDCAACHGLSGRGDGFVAPMLLRKPKDLATTRFSVRLLSQVLWNGKRGTAMPSWRSLPQKDLGALAAYVQTLHQPATGGTVTREDRERGNQVFLQNCAPCHGVTGDGTGTAATALIPAPANFQLKQPDFNYILQVLSDGIPGTGMPAWKDQIPEPDRGALAHFVRSLFKGDSLSEH